MLAHAGVIAFTDRRWLEQLAEEIHPGIFQLLSPLGEGLQDEMIAVAIDEQRRQEITFPKHEPIGIGVADHGPAIVDPRQQALPPKFSIGSGNQRAHQRRVICEASL